ncbi:hypothetical protein [Andreprevotia chitinilytica]|uniref:hypothetical protein n=1 Tax=Andreprevotia chitinilytica TaxID=396808 RepID=UPI0005524FD0|nr:hypothetical protein [Andreprevotia chitinilytica]
MQITTRLIGVLAAVLFTPFAMAQSNSCNKLANKAARKACLAKTATQAPAPAPVPSVPVGQAGIYDVNYGLFSGVYTLLDDGRFSGIHMYNGALAGHPHGVLPADNSPSHLSPIAWANFIDDYQQVGKQEIDPRFGRSFGDNTLSVTIVGGFGTFSTTQNEQKTYGYDSGTALYLQPLPLTTLAGRYTGAMRSVGIDKPQEQISAFSITADGRFEVNAVDCQFSGQMVQYKTTGVYEASTQASGANCKYTAQLAGLVTPVAVNNGKARLAFQLDTADNRQTAVFLISQQ